MNDLVEKALSVGFSKAIWLDDLNIECEERLRAYCNPDGCPNHGQNWVCPPGCGSLSECAEKVGRFHSGILVQSITDLTPPVGRDTYKSLNLIHNQKLRKLIDFPDEPSFDLLALTTGGCIFCDKCVYPEPCVKPGKRMNSLSAFGIDVGKLCLMANLDYSFSANKVYYTALVLVRPRLKGALA